MPASRPALSPAEAAARLGVSVKALRLYEQRGLIAPQRSTVGWRVYGPETLARAAEIVALRGLGLSLAQIARVLAGAPEDLDAALAAQQSALEIQVRHLAETAARLHGLRRELAQGRMPAAADLARLTRPDDAVTIAFDLPWPWGGERFELRGLPAVTYLTGPLGSGKTRLALCLAEGLPGARFLPLDRSAEDARRQMDADPALAARVGETLAWLTGDGACASDALVALVAGLEAEGPGALVVDLIEQGLDPLSQEALGAFLRRRPQTNRPLIVLTRSTAILDLSAVGADAAILLCPANHSPPIRVAPYPGAPGHDALVTCLATPEARARVGELIVQRAS